jgi:hypothetical protein
MDKPPFIFGYWIETPTDIYFVRGPQDAKEEHKGIWETPLPGVTLETVLKYKDIAHWVVRRHLKQGIIIHSRWTPESPYPLEHDHSGKIAFEVLDFGETEEEAIAIVNHFKSQK